MNEEIDSKEMKCDENGTSDEKVYTECFEQGYDILVWDGWISYKSLIFLEW